MINCPSCGSNFEGDLRLGCPSCGARSVGPPLAKAEHELPSYGRAVIVSAGGVAMSGVFLGFGDRGPDRVQGISASLRVDC